MFMHENDIARICHEANREYCAAQGDHSQPTWENAPEWQKQSAINGVRHHLLHPESGPEISHQLWMKEKVDAGWIYGPIKDPERKIHPCIRPYDQLPEFQRRKDSLFTAIVNALR